MRNFILGKLIPGFLCFACAEIPAQTRLFEHLETSFRMGTVIPGGNLARTLTPFPAGGVMAHTPYYQRFQVHAAFHYGLLAAETIARDLHYAKVGLGLGYAPLQAWLPEVGLGFNSVALGAVGSPKPKVYLLDTYESEFGFYPFATWKVGWASGWALRLGAEWDLVLSQPRYSPFPFVYLAMGKTWW